MQGTKMCHNCWEVRTRIARMPEQVIHKIVQDLGSEEQTSVIEAVDALKKKLRDYEEHF